mgnify:FL=1
MVDKPPVLVRCSCHGQEVMAEIIDDNLVLRKRIHGRQHVLLTKIADECILKIVQLSNCET